MVEKFQISQWGAPLDEPEPGAGSWSERTPAAPLPAAIALPHEPAEEEERSDEEAEGRRREGGERGRAGERASDGDRARDGEMGAASRAVRSSGPAWAGGGRLRDETARDERYEMFLYMFSGVLLLFMLEQFLQIGILLGARMAKADLSRFVAAGV
jgi:hypothetical protein